MSRGEEWNSRFLAGEHSNASTDPFVAGCSDFWALLPGGLGSRAAADLACGAGRHAIYLAEQGFQTVAVDFSEAALEIVRLRAVDRGLSVERQQIDLEAPGADLGVERFDVVVVVHFLHRPLFEVVKRALKPGGLAVYKTYTSDQLALGNGPKNPAYVLQANELLREFGDYRVLRYEEKMSGEGTAAILAQKP
jgi:tellurite methyltransferase